MAPFRAGAVAATRAPISWPAVIESREKSFALKGTHRFHCYQWNQSWPSGSPQQTACASYHDGVTFHSLPFHLPGLPLPPALITICSLLEGMFPKQGPTYLVCSPCFIVQLNHSCVKAKKDNSHVCNIRNEFRHSAQLVSISITDMAKHVGVGLQHPVNGDRCK